MCIIILKPAGRSWPSFDKVRQATQENPDGFGLVARTRRGNVRMVKGMFDVDRIWHTLNSVSDREPAVAHWRWATHGAKTRDNCHPFRGHDWHLVHNGVLPRPWSSDSRTSDTVQLVRALKSTPFAELVRAKPLLENMVSGSRVVLFSDEGEALILNEDDGLWREDDGLWYSNRSLTRASWFYEWPPLKRTTTATPATLPTPKPERRTPAVPEWECSVCAQPHYLRSSEFCISCGASRDDYLPSWAGVSAGDVAAVESIIEAGYSVEQASEWVGLDEAACRDIAEAAGLVELDHGQ